MSQCPPLPPPSEPETMDFLVQIIQAMGIQACQTEYNFEKYKASIGNIFAKAKVEVTNESKKTIGCEDLEILANKYRQVKYDISCILRQNSQTIETGVFGIQTINIISEQGSINISCPKFVIRQNMKLNLISSVAVLNDSQQNQIVEKTNEFVTDMFDIIKKTIEENKKWDRSDPNTPSKKIEVMMAQFDDIKFKQDIRNSFQDITVSVTGAQAINIKAKFDINITTNEQCSLSQDMVLDVIADLIMQNAVSNVMGPISREMNIYRSPGNTETDKDEENETKNLLIYLSLGLVLLIILVITIILIYKKKS